MGPKDVRKGKTSVPMRPVELQRCGADRKDC